MKGHGHDQSSERGLSPFGRDHCLKALWFDMPLFWQCDWTPLGILAERTLTFGMASGWKGAVPELGASQFCFERGSGSGATDRISARAW